VLAEERNLKPSLSDEGEEWSILKGPNYLGKGSWVMVTNFSKGLNAVLHKCKLMLMNTFLNYSLCGTSKTKGKLC
jgi:hypothetical protein